MEQPSARFSLRDLPKDLIQKVQANDPEQTRVDFSGSTLFQMKPDDYTTMLSDALRGNQYVKEVVLQDCALNDSCATSLASMLAVNNTITILNLKNNRITNTGVSELARGLTENQGLLQLELLNQNAPFGEACLGEFMKMLQKNITLQKITWRLESRQSFAITKMLNRNTEITRRRTTNRDYADLLPQSLRESSENGGELEDMVSESDNSSPMAAPQSVPPQQSSTTNEKANLNLDEAFAQQTTVSENPPDFQGSGRKDSLAALRGSGAVGNLKSMFGDQ
jgi:hypothetical protein